jgi:hypothetical protein
LQIGTVGNYEIACSKWLWSQYHYITINVNPKEGLLSFQGATAANIDCMILYSRKTGILVFSARLEDQSAVESVANSLSTNGIDHQKFLGKEVN